MWLGWNFFERSVHRKLFLKKKIRLRVLTSYDVTILLSKTYFNVDIIFIRNHFFIYVSVVICYTFKLIVLLVGNFKSVGFLVFLRLLHIFRVFSWSERCLSYFDFHHLILIIQLLNQVYPLSSPICQCI